MNKLFEFAIHFSVFVISALLITSKPNFYTLLTTVATNRLLHLLHTSLAIHFILFVGGRITNKSLGDLLESEYSAYREKVYDIVGDFLMLISIFPGDLSIPCLIVFSVLYSFKSFSWIFAIKAQKGSSMKMICTGCAVLSVSLAMAIYYNRMVSSISILFTLEYSLVCLSLCKDLCIMAMDLNEIEENRSFYTFVISIVYMGVKSLVFVMFIVQITVRHRFPYNTARSLLATIYKLGKKIVLFKKYMKLCEDLDSIREEQVDETCAICTDDISTGKKLRCGHAFHSTCLKMWCERETTCPICRVELIFNKEEVIETPNETITGIPVNIEA